MTEQPPLDQPGCSAASVQIPDTLHIDLPRVDPQDICFTLNKCLVQMTTQQWKLITGGIVSCAMMTVLANSCMDIIQTFAEAILDVVMPQVYRYLRTYGSFSPSVLDLTEDRIHTYLGDSIEQALANCLKMKVQNSVATKVFSQLLLRHISKTINSVLDLSTQTPILESSLPVFFVSGCVTSIKDLKDMVCQIATILMEALEGQGQSSQTALCEPREGAESPVFCLNSICNLKKLVKTYIIRIVKVLKSRAQMPHCEMSSWNHSDVCIRVGTNIQILTMEDRESHEQQSATSSYSGVDAIPGVVPNSDDAKSHSDNCPFHSVTIIAATEDHSCLLGPTEMESIKNIVDELVQAFWEEDLQGTAQTDSYQKAVHSGKEVIDNVKIRELTDKIFNVIMSGRDYQISLVPAGSRICDTVTYRKPRRGDFSNPGIIAHALYMRTEELVTRCAVQVLLLSGLCPWVSDFPSSLTFDELPYDPDYMLVPRQAAGDCVEIGFVIPPSLHNSSILSQASNATYDATPESLEPTQSQLLGGIVHTSLLSLLVGEMLAVIGIRDSEIIFEVVKKAVEQLQDVDPEVYNHFHATLMGRSYKDIYQTAITDLLLEFGSVQVMREAVSSEDPSFEEAILRALRKQLRIPTSPTQNSTHHPVPHGKEAKKTIWGFFKKFKRMCCKITLKKVGKTTTVISLTSDQDGKELQDHLSKGEPRKEQTEQHQCSLMSRIATSTRNRCSSAKKMFSSIARALGRPFVACFSPKSQ
ncbi:uncharacterized protein LOC122863675 [Siniperca chuatsi]|uniref:uncharacterized protein LOC122863675 n=1 Tax=Siniperca chuatsi TaxID=119488 RepID=UPI001CE227FC|nr:uncharacterized protein LOC122863675 [Siniperca chuatsi]